ncbi:MAG: PD40 domain-containing protein [Planctomycetota bacterium]|nr:PD40 domain-containing protein [Planctomycetota bacterium]
MERKQATPRRRRTPRFSISSLLCFSLLTGSAGMLWSDWAPWHEIFRLSDAGREVGRITYSDDGRLLLTQPDLKRKRYGFSPFGSRPFRIWNARDGSLKRKLEWGVEFNAAWTRAQFSNDGRWIMFGEGLEDQAARMFDLATGEDYFKDLPASAVRWIFHFPKRNQALVIFNIRRAPLLLNLDAPLRAIELTEAPRVWEGHDLSSDGRYLLLHGHTPPLPPHLTVYDLETGQLAFTHEGLWNYPTLPRFSHQDRYVMFGYGLEDLPVITECWDWRKQRQVLRKSGPYRVQVLSSRQVSVATTGGLDLYRAEDMAYIAHISCRNTSPFPVIDPTGTRLASIDQKGNNYVAQVHDLATGHGLQTFDLGTITWSYFSEFPDELSFTDDGAWLIVKTSANTQFLPMQGQAPAEPIGDHPVLSPDGKRVLILSERGHAGIYAFPSQELLQHLGETADHLAEPSFSPDGTRLLFLDKDGDVHCFERRWPEAWWGLFARPGFWLTLVAALVFCGSLRRDRRRFKQMMQA